jgi:hypothetical protein
LYLCPLNNTIIVDMENMYDLEIALQIIVQIKVIRMNELEKTTDELQREKLQKEITMLWAEEKALYSNDVIRQSIMDKAFRLYGPILKTKYATA